MHDTNFYDACGKTFMPISVPEAQALEYDPYSLASLGEQIQAEVLVDIFGDESVWKGIKDAQTTFVRQTQNAIRAYLG